MMFPNIPDEEFETLSNLFLQDTIYLLTIINSIHQSYKSKIGNCGELCAVGLYFASNIGAHLLHSASIINLKNLDHSILKLETKNKEIIYLDPWFKNSEHSGAIFYPESRTLYLNAAFNLLCINNHIKIVGPIYPARYVIGIALLALAIYDQDPLKPSLIILFGIFLLPLSILPVIREYYLSQPVLNERLTIHNSPDPLIMSFQLFEKLCVLNVENIQSEPVIFRKRSSSLQEYKSEISPDQNQPKNKAKI